jgi:hypothetical protein
MAKVAKPRTAPTLGVRALNRALLARQHLLARSALPAARAIEHLVGLQAQVPRSPYFALWSRLQDFRPQAVERLLEGRRAVRMALMRGTLHLVSTRDARALRPAMQPVLARALHVGSPYGRALRGLSAELVVAAGKKLVEQRPHTQAELRAALGPLFPRHDAIALSYVVHYLLPMVQVPPRGLWRSSGLPTWTTEEAWLGEAPGPAMPLAQLVWRYLGAFGPASPRDAQVWSGLPGLGPVFEQLRPRLRTFRDERGRELFDLLRAPRPAAETPAPPRFLPEFDNVFLSHADRARIVGPAQARRLPRIGPPPGVVLVDGFIEGTWKLERGKRTTSLTVTPFRRLLRRERAELQEEAARLLRFAAPDAKASLRIQAPD